MGYVKRTDDLCQDILANDNLVQANQTFSLTQLAKFLDEELHNTICVLATKARQEYFVHSAQQGVVAGQLRATLPSIAPRLRDIYYNSLVQGGYIKINRINPDQVPYLGPFPYQMSSMLATPTYFIENNDIVFVPPVQYQCTLTFKYFHQPNHLDLYNNCAGTVLSKAPGNQLTLDNVPTSWNGTSTTIDVLLGNTPYSFRQLPGQGNSVLPMIDIPLVAVASPYITVDTNTYNNVQVGDMICSNEYAPVIQFLPEESYRLVVVRAAMRCAQALGDMTKLAALSQTYEAAADDFYNLISPRVESQPKKAVANNSPMKYVRVRRGLP